MLVFGRDSNLDRLAALRPVGARIVPCHRVQLFDDLHSFAGESGRHAGFPCDIKRQPGLSQEALGELCDLHRTELSLLERAGREPRLSTIVRLSRALRVTPHELLRGIR